MTIKKVLLEYDDETGYLSQLKTGFSYQVGTGYLIEEFTGKGQSIEVVVELKRAGFEADDIIKLRNGGVI